MLLIIPFVVQDPANRAERESTKIFSKAVRKHLLQTHWRLMSNVSYRLGVITGSLKAYETDEDLMNLMGNPVNPIVPYGNPD